MNEKEIDYLQLAKDQEFEVLKEIKRVCDKNNLRYFLAYGTLLGCIRHKGFIPWDDDIDILMFRADYERLKQIWKNEANPKFQILDYDTVKNYPYTFPKIGNTDVFIKEDSIAHVDFKLGFYVDVFILDGSDSNEAKRLKNIKKDSFLTDVIRQMQRDKNRMNKFFNLCRNILVSIVPVIKVQRYKDNQLSKYKVENSDLLYATENYKPSCLIPKEWFNETEEKLFEGTLFTVPKEWDKLLTYEYGDYMQLPPEDERISHHYFKIVEK